jgi:integrase
MRKTTLSDRGVVAIRPRAMTFAFPDPQMIGLYIRIAPTGSRSFVVVARDPFGRQVWHTVGNCSVLRIDESRELGRSAIKRIKAGNPPVEPPPVKPDSFRSVAEKWLKRHVAANNLRSEHEIKRSLEKYVYPKWAERDFIDIRRRDITALLDHVEDHHGSRMADLVLAYVRGMANWFAVRDDDYVSPFTRGMRRHTKPARERILDDSELRTLWGAAEVSGQFGAIVRLCLLTCQRVDKIRTMKWSDLVDGTWIIATAEREKGNAGSLVLPPLALQIIAEQTRIGDNPFVFPGRGNGCFNNARAASRFAAKLSDMPHWQVHDLRRSARSMLSRCGISHETSERILGHRVGSAVSQIYDRHKYDHEKKIALEKLAQLIDGIVNERANVLPLTKRKST